MHCPTTPRLPHHRDWQPGRAQAPLQQFEAATDTGQQVVHFMAHAARERVIEKFSMKRMVSELEKIYLEVKGMEIGD